MSFGEFVRISQKVEHQKWVNDWYQVYDGWLHFGGVLEKHKTIYKLSLILRLCRMELTWSESEQNIRKRAEDAIIFAFSVNT